MSPKPHTRAHQRTPWALKNRGVRPYWADWSLLLDANDRPRLDRKSLTPFRRPRGVVVVDGERGSSEFLAASLPLLRRIPLAVYAVLTAASVWFALFHVQHTLELQTIRCVYWGIPGLLILASFVGSEHLLPFKRFRPLLLLGDASYFDALPGTAASGYRFDSDIEGSLTEEEPREVADATT